jgi:hypothetical protein
MSPPILSSTARCAGTGEQRRQATVLEGLAPVTEVVDDAVERIEEPLRVGLHGVEGLLHEPEVVLTQPRHARELRSMGDLVERQPEPELLRREREPLLERQDVGTDVVHEVLVVRRGRLRVVDDEQVVLAQHARGHPPEQHADLDASEATRHACGEAGPHVVTQLVGERAEQPLEAVDVGVHPAGAVGDPRTRGTREAAKAGRLRHQLLGLRRRFLEVRLERLREVGRGERLPAGGSDGNPLGELPVDRTAHDGVSRRARSEGIRSSAGRRRRSRP